MKTVLIYILTIVFFLFTGNMLFAQQTSFQGNWVINQSKTVFNDIPQWVVPSRIQVTEGSFLSIQRFVKDKDGKESSYTEKFEGDQGTCETTLRNALKRKASVQWNDPKSGFAISSQSTGADGKPNNKIKETWSIEDKGKTLVTNREVERGDGYLYTIKIYYDKN